METEKFRAIILFGAPGVGKGTQGRILNQIPGFRHVSSGDIFRSLDPESPEGREVASYTNRGELVPDDVTIRIFHTMMRQSVEKGVYRPAEEILLLDGIPRTVRQAEVLAGSFSVLAVIEFRFSDEEIMVERLKGRALKEGRLDDADEATIRHRFDVYRQQTAPVLQFYPPELVRSVNADATPIEVLRETLDALIPIYRDQLAAAIT